ncbi:MAG: nucleotidyltransferase domain-containing protein [Myxococcales bacterium]|nr:nucleotidyltransferase domain-containing protein [Myxococcales bacterium]
MTDTPKQTPKLASDLPETVRDRLGDLASTLKSQLGDNLAALLVFGSAVRGGFRPGVSDVDLILVLADPSREALLSVANTLTVARSAFRFEAVILGADEIPRAADVFPLFYDDIKSCHVVLSGKDPFAALEISDQHRRLRIEQELRESQIRLRRAVVDGLGAGPQLAGAVERKVKQLRGPLHALLSLRKSPAKDDTLPTLLEKAAAVYDVDTAPLSSVRKDPDAAHDALQKLLDHMIREVDQMES